MAINAPKVPQKDLSQFSPSTFTLTFAIEILGIDVWHDCNEGWLDLGPCIQGMKIQYQLYPGQNFDIDILIWPHAVKIWCGSNYGWVRTWQFLDRRWLTFDICHAFPVRVVDLRSHVATVNPTLGLGSLGANAKNDRNTEVYLPALKFMERRYFASVQEAEPSLFEYLYNLIWKKVESYIPASYLDGVFDVPTPVTVVRHQDAVLYHVKECILSRNTSDTSVEESLKVESKPSANERGKAVKKKGDSPKAKFEIKLSGDTILAGTGRQVPFQTTGDRPADLGELIVLISSNNLPASDDLPIIFVNVDKLFDVPIDTFKKLKITQIYTKWALGEEEHSSEPQTLKRKSEFDLNDHHAVPLPCDISPDTISRFWDTNFEIQLRGIRQQPQPGGGPKFFGYDKKDRDFGTAAPPKLANDDIDIIIAVTKIDVRSLAKGFSFSMKGEFDLYPPSSSVVHLSREPACTNDINGIRAPVRPELVVQPFTILEAQMTMQVNIGFVGCRPQKPRISYSRMFCLVNETEVIMSILEQITELNDEMTEAMLYDNLITGFALDIGDNVIFYAEGPKDGAILKVWERTEDFYPTAKPVFSTSPKYFGRLYPSLLPSSVPFVVLKMYVPLCALLACPPVYARPALPLLTKTAVLKFGRLVASKLTTAPRRCDMPSPEELISFKLELCVPPRPANISLAQTAVLKPSTHLLRI